MEKVEKGDTPVRQDRDGFPDEYLKEKRFFEMYGSGKTDTPKGWNTPSNWKYISEIDSDKTVGYTVCNQTYNLMIDGDHCIDEHGKLLPQAQNIVENIKRMSGTYFELSMSGTGFHGFLDLTGVCEDIPVITNDAASIIVWMNPNDYEALPKKERDKVPKIELFFRTAGRYVFLTGNHNDLFTKEPILKGKKARDVYNYLVMIREGNHSIYGYKNPPQNIVLNGNVVTDKQPTKINSRISNLKLKEVAEVMDKWIPPDNYVEWVRVGQSLRNSFGDVAFTVWDSWSSKSVKYKPEEMQKKWLSFNGTSNWNIGTIFKLAKSYGYKEQYKAAGSDKQPHQTSADPEEKYEIVQPEFFLSKKGQIISDVRNAKVFLDFILKGCIRYNNLTNRVDIFGAVPWNKDADEVRPWKDTDTSNALMLANGYGLKNKNYLIDAISIIAEENKYHPIKDYLESLEYLGEGYIRRLAVEYMGCEDSEYTYECMKLLLLAMVQRVYYPGCKYDYVLIFQGPQGSYKSTFWKTLSRDDDWFSDCVESFKSRKDLGELLQGKWLVELSEMSAFKKSEIESIKAAVTSQCDSYREAYGRFRSDYPRTTIFVGTTNNQTFLKDSTGNRRFIILPINKERRIKDLFTCDTRDQDFEGALAEALHIFKEYTKNGKPMPLVLPKSVMAEAEERQNNANAYDEWTGIIDSWLEKQVKEHNKRYTSGLDIWVNCLSRDKGSYSSKETARINQILDSLPDWERSTSVRITDGFETAPFHGRGFKYVGEIPEDVPFD